ncbi:MAG TPA: hypothetical protein VFG76_07790, partial [Candidatus Polarisedimenticolia bacterium]|nr:hypothetical protein [Candidatus Polarisedimenticolia bacterium]
MRALSKLAELVARGGEPSRIYEAALETIVALAHADRAAILVRDESGRIRCAAGHGLSDRLRAALEEP